MKYIADLHIHSLYSRATSKSSHLHGLASWANIKGIHVVGTGDFTHPGWFQHLKENLEESEPGFLRLKEQDKRNFDGVLPEGLEAQYRDVRFVLTSEISSIYKRHDKVRKVHSIIFVPDFQSAERINKVLSGIGNLESDGRPILGLDSRNLLEIVLENSTDGFLVPAHIWTPWFSLFGSKSGFDTIDECFADLSNHIFALETGLSSDPDMNRCVSALDRFSLISNSDCHSPSKLGREANIFDTDFDYYSMRDGLRFPVNKDGSQVFTGTIEFFPEEGKYHCDGHRKCNVCLKPEETNNLKGLCPHCGKPVTIGVLNRVMALADREIPLYPQGSPTVFSLVPLVEILSELLGIGSTSKKVLNTYSQLIKKFGSEFNILLQTSLTDLADGSSHILSEAINRVRKGRVFRKPGFDGEFGVIRVFSEEERHQFGGQLSLFGIRPAKPDKKTRTITINKAVIDGPDKIFENNRSLNSEQYEVVQSSAKRIIVKAGPGTGKTHTLVQRVIRLVREGKTPCTIITFTNKAADEITERIKNKLEYKRNDIFVGTFHGFCLYWLRKESPELKVIGPQTRRWILQSIYQQQNSDELKKIDQEISRFFLSNIDEKITCPEYLSPYFHFLQTQNLIDIDEVIPRMLIMLMKDKKNNSTVRSRVGHLFVDEFQDLNLIQYELISVLSQTSSLFAIGDPDQAIYGFRGSSPVFFHKFIKEFKPEVHVLHRNYRCAKTIISAAQNLIENNVRMDRVETIEAVRNSAGTLYLYESGSEKEEADFVVEQIENMLGGTSHREIEKLSGKEREINSLDEIAVIYRTSKQAEIIAESLGRHGIPYQVVDIEPFYLKLPVRKLYLFILVASGMDEAGDFFDLLSYEKGIGTKSIQLVRQYFQAGSRNNLDLLLDILKVKHRNIERLCIGVENLSNTVKVFKEKAKSKGICAGLTDVIEQYDIKEDDRNVGRFLRLATTFGKSIDDFANHLLRYSETVIYDARAQCVTLMTLHAAKGLEFPIVFIIGLEDGLIPLLRRDQQSTTKEEKQLLEEERRLLFVGITRAIDVLILSYSTSKNIFGKKEAQNPSRFLQEIPTRLFTLLERKSRIRKSRKSTARQLTLF